MALRTLEVADGFASAGIPSDAVTVAKLNDATGAPFSAGNRLPVDIGTVSLTVSNEVEIKNDSGNPVPVNGTVAVSNSFALESTATNGNQKTQIVNASNTSITSSTVLGSERLNVTLASGSATGVTPPTYTNMTGAIDTATGFAQQLRTTSNRLLVDGSGVTQPISGTVTANSGTNLNTSLLGLETTQVANGVLVGAVTEAAPASDTASSGQNGRLQRIAQRISSLISLFPTSLGQGTMSTSMKVVIASDQTSIPTIQGASLNGTIVNTTLTGTTATANTPPANAVGFFIGADSSNTDSIRWAIGSTASASVGSRLEAGRSGDSYIPCKATVSVCAEVSGTNRFFIQWILSV